MPHCQSFYKTASEGPGLRRKKRKLLRIYRMDESADSKVVNKDKDEAKKDEEKEEEEEEENGVYNFEEGGGGVDKGDNPKERDDGDMNKDCEATPTQSRQEYNTNTLLYTRETDGSQTDDDTTPSNHYQPATHIQDNPIDNAPTSANCSIPPNNIAPLQTGDHPMHFEMQDHVAMGMVPTQLIFLSVNTSWVSTLQPKPKTSPCQRKGYSNAPVESEDNDTGPKMNLAAKKSADTDSLQKQRKMSNDEVNTDQPKSIKCTPQPEPKRPPSWQPTKKLCKKNKQLVQKLGQYEEKGNTLIQEGQGLVQNLEECKKEVKALSDMLKEHEDPKGSFQQAIVTTATEKTKEEKCALAVEHRQQLEKLRAENARKESELMEKLKKDAEKWGTGVKAKLDEEKLRAEELWKTAIALEKTVADAKEDAKQARLKMMEKEALVKEALRKETEVKQALEDAKRALQDMQEKDAVRMDIEGDCKLIKRQLREERAENKKEEKLTAEMAHHKKIFNDERKRRENEFNIEMAHHTKEFNKEIACLQNEAAQKIIELKKFQAKKLVEVARALLSRINHLK